MAKISIITFGCALNISDSELIAGLLENEGYDVVDEPEKADLIIINTCTVKNSAETKLFKELKKYKNKKIIIAGCIPQAEQSMIDDELKDYSIIGTKQMINAPQVVEETLKGNRVVVIERTKNKRLLLPKIRQNETIEIIPINEGCLGACNYCKTKHARGNIISYDEKDILGQVKNAVLDGVTQIWLTSQDTGAYGYDTGTNIVELLKNILQIKGDYKVRLGMINPDHAKEYLDGLIELFKDEKMFRFIHLPIQSASNKVLKEMNRKYTKEDFIEIVKRLRENIPEITIATDVIIGYPTENDKDFDETYDLIEKIKPEILNMSRFWPRPKTPAAKLKIIDTKTVKERSKKIKILFESAAKEQKKQYLNKELEVLTEKIESGQTHAKTDNHTIVIIDGKINPGTRMKVKIIKTEKWNLVGIPIK